MSNTQTICLKVGKTKYELLTKTGTVKLFRDGKLGIGKVLVADEVFTDAKAGTRAPVGKMLSDLGVSTQEEAVQKILEKGQFELTTAERQRAVKEKRGEIIGFIAANYVDTAGKPLPYARVENTLDQIKGLKIDPFIEAPMQVPDIVKLFDKILPVRLNALDGEVKVPKDFTQQVERYVKAKAKLLEMKKVSDGVVFTVRLAPGAYDEFVGAIGKMTSGYFEIDFPAMKH